MSAVGIDVSKGKSMVSIIRPMGEIVQAPTEVIHAKDVVVIDILRDIVEGVIKLVVLAGELIYYPFYYGNKKIKEEAGEHGAGNDYRRTAEKSEHGGQRIRADPGDRAPAHAHQRRRHTEAQTCREAARKRSTYSSQC